MKTCLCLAPHMRLAFCLHENSWLWYLTKNEIEEFIKLPISYSLDTDFLIFKLCISIQNTVVIYCKCDISADYVSYK